MRHYGDRRLLPFIRLLFKPKDLLVGVYWHVRRDCGFRVLLVYVCLIPMSTIRLAWYTRLEEVPETG